MDVDARDLANLLVAGSVFGLVLSFWFGSVLFWARRRSARLQAVGQRLGVANPHATQAQAIRLWREEGRAREAAAGAVRRSGPLGRLERLLREAGWEGHARTLLLGVLGVTALLVAFTLVVLNSALLGLAIAAVVITVFWMFVKRRINRQAALFDRQFVEALDLGARSLRAGHPLVGAFRLISEEFSAPVGTIFAQICQQQALGLGLDEALRNAAAASTSAELKLLATSVVIQMRTGGNLVDVMGRVAFVIRDRMRLNRRVRVLTAQTQFSKRILLGLPFFVFMLLNVLNPDYMAALYTTTAGIYVLAAGGLSLLLGAWTMNRLATLHY